MTLREVTRAVISLVENALAVLRRAPELIEPGEITFIAHALVVPSSEPADLEQIWGRA